MKRSLPALLVAAALILAPAAAVAAPAQPVTTECVVEGSALEWGFKESFRAYIDGAIANGEWEVADGADYETPTFRWSGGTGSVDGADLTGEIAFRGSVRFLGHGGVLDMTIANPVVRFDGPREATILLDVFGVTMNGDPIDAERVPFVDVDLAGVGSLVREADVVRVDAPTSLTPEGAQTFPNYEVGDAFDPIALDFPVGGDCTLTGATGSMPNALTWVFVIGGAVVLLAAIVVVLLVVRRRR